MSLSFVLCPFAILCWKEIKLDGITYSTSLEVECFYEFLFSLLSIQVKCIRVWKICYGVMEIWRT